MRIEHARRNYREDGLSFVCRDFRDSLDDIGLFDFVWVRFVLEYHRSGAFGIVEKLNKILKPGGVLCLIDLDHNCLNHYGAPERFVNAINNIMKIVEVNEDFDPYVGRKLFSYLYDLGYEDINVKISPHHLIYGEIGEVDEFNFVKKLK
ncbi:MAG: class I SAM-dependent methyltransferase [Syntrophotaleaceae bacterium]